MSAILDRFKNLSGETKALFVFIPLILIAMLSAWYDKPVVVAPQGYTQAPAIKGTATTKVEVPIKLGKVKIIPKAVVKKAIPELPPEIDNDSTEVTGTAVIPPSETGTDVVTTIDTITGDTKIISKPKELSLFAFESKASIGLGYGYSTSGTVADVHGTYQFLRVGNAHVGVRGEIVATSYRSPEAKILATIDYNFTK